MNRKIWLDDVRPAPEGWEWYKTAEDLIRLLKIASWHTIEEISFDHDLGEGQQTGYDVLKYMEEEVLTYKMKVPWLSIHSQNPVGCQNMKAAIQSIVRHSK